VEFRPHDRARADARARSALVRRHVRPRPSDTVRRVATAAMATGGGKGVLAEHDSLARNLLLVGPAYVIVAHHARVGRRALRPIDPAVLELQQLGRVVTGGQPGDAWRDRAVAEDKDHYG